MVPVATFPGEGSVAGPLPTPMMLLIFPAIGAIDDVGQSVGFKSLSRITTPASVFSHMRPD